ncbi:MAG TPA: protein-methionine-sulfoxide reductase heme-binding subunit MsrQ [Burkholderiaceae bacterium]|nr:protein-methionine-sulfoxide reductase heme-binding subunit MsrQ [Burkholderiaceae bacterium]
MRTLDVTTLPARTAANSQPRSASSLSPRALRSVKVAVFVLCLVPFVRLFVLGGLDRLGTNPVEFVTRSTGTWTLVMLCVTLSVTPLRRMLGWNWLIRLRRMLGLFAFFYATVHFTTYVWFDQWFELTEIARDIVERPFITVGFVAFVTLIPLAATSTDAMMRRLGRRWSMLHRLAYVAAIAGVVHFWWHKSAKNDLGEPLIYAAIVAALLGWRLWARLRDGRARARTPSPIAPPPPRGG